MKNKSQKGFTLIELLVVIAIIAVLSSLAFVGLQNARRRGNDVAMLATANGIRAQAQICLDSTTTTTAITAATSATFSTAGGGGNICGATAWPIPITGWSYGTISGTNPNYSCASGTPSVDQDVTKGNYGFCAINTIDNNKKVICSQDTCSHPGF